MGYVEYFDVVVVGFFLLIVYIVGDYYLVEWVCGGDCGGIGG